MGKRDILFGEVESVVGLFNSQVGRLFPTVSGQGKEFVPGVNQHTNFFIENILLLNFLWLSHSGLKSLFHCGLVQVDPWTTL